MHKIQILTEKPKMGDQIYDQPCCPYCYERLNSTYIANFEPKPIEDFQNRVIKIVCQKCKKEIIYPFCPYQEPFPAQSPHNTSCARALGCGNWFHNLCPSVCYETNQQLEAKGDLEWKEYMNKMIKLLLFRVIYKNAEKIACYKFQSSEDLK